MLLLACSGEEHPAPADAQAEAAADSGLHDGGADGDVDVGPDAPGDGADATSDGSAPPTCPDDDLGARLGSRVAAGNTADGSDQFSPSCDDGLASPDRSFAFSPAVDGPYRVRAEAGFRGTVAVFDGCEGARELACGTDALGTEPTAIFDAVAGRSYVIVVDGGGGVGGAFWLNVEAAETCGDGTDDDGDGDRDCADPDCAWHAACRELACRDGNDSDGDGRTDCEDPDCFTACFESNCVGMIDDDRDGLVDCLDPDCQARCAEADCGDGIDDDNDGLTDCEDPSCLGQMECAESECGDGIDNNDDGLTDCQDPACAQRLRSCVETICDDGVDDDGDGSVDCADSDCFADGACCEPRCPLSDLGSRLGLSVATGDAREHCDSLTAESCARPLPGGQDVAFTFTAPADGVYEMETAGSDYVTGISVFDADRCEDVSVTNRLACDSQSARRTFGDPVSRVRLRLSRGQTVLIAIDVVEGGGAGRYQLNIWQL